MILKSITVIIILALIEPRQAKNMPSAHARTAKAQIRLRIRAVWSGPSLSAARIIGDNRMYQ